MLYSQSLIKGYAGNHSCAQANKYTVRTLTHRYACLSHVLTLSLRQMRLISFSRCCNLLLHKLTSVNANPSVGVIKPRAKCQRTCQSTTHICTHTLAHTCVCSVCTLCVYLRVSVCVCVKLISQSGRLSKQFHCANSIKIYSKRQRQLLKSAAAAAAATTIGTTTATSVQESI